YRGRLQSGEVSCLAIEYGRRLSGCDGAVLRHHGWSDCGDGSRVRSVVKLRLSACGRREVEPHAQQEDGGKRGEREDDCDVAFPVSGKPFQQVRHQEAPLGPSLSMAIMGFC